MIDLKDNLKCTGCGACQDICPVDAITMIEDKEGFLFPKVNTNICIGCNKCNKVCQLESMAPTSIDNQQFFAAANIDELDLKRSSSGGMFLALAKWTLNNNGYVVGCVFDENLFAKHIITNKLEDVYKMCGSKYVQSNLSGIYLLMKEKLQQGFKVLFTGTPCQVEGVLKYFGTKYENLITVDIICHGVSAPKLWSEHIKYLEIKNKGKILDYSFRNKVNSWGYFYVYKFSKKNKKCIKKGNCDLDKYYSDFLVGKNFRECCYQCSYANLNRVSDFTIGDYWGGETIHHSFEQEKGISLLILNTKKAKYIYKNLNIKSEKTELEYVLRKNHKLYKPTARNLDRNDYYLNIYNDFISYENRFTKTKQWKILKLKSLIPSRLKKFIKKIVK